MDRQWLIGRVCTQQKVKSPIIHKLFVCYEFVLKLSITSPKTCGDVGSELSSNIDLFDLFDLNWTNLTNLTKFYESVT